MTNTDKILSQIETAQARLKSAADWVIAHRAALDSDQLQRAFARDTLSVDLFVYLAPGTDAATVAKTFSNEWMRRQTGETVAWDGKIVDGIEITICDAEKSAERKVAL